MIDTFNSRRVRELSIRVERYRGSTLMETYTSADRVKEWKITRSCDQDRFFGFGISQKLNLELLDGNRELELTTADSYKVYIINNDVEYCPYPMFYEYEVRRNQTNYTLSITAYDALYYYQQHHTEEFGEQKPTSMAAYAGAVVSQIGMVDATTFINIPATISGREYPKGANIEGTETIREFLDDIAEATQSIYYIDGNNTLTFRRLNSEENPYVIDKNLYLSLETSSGKRLGKIVHVTELGDNVSSTESLDKGTTQYVRDNVFWELRDDIGAIVEEAYQNLYRFSLDQYEVEWIYSPALSIGDRIQLIAKDGTPYYSYYLNTTVDYNGRLKDDAEWHYNASDAETDENPSTLGELLKRTYARVDKANAEIILVASKADNAVSNVAQLKITTSQIESTVKETQEGLEDSVNDINNRLEMLERSVDVEQDTDKFEIRVNKILTNGVEQVATTAGYTFNADGLTISKSDDDVSTKITNNGMTIRQNFNDVLTVNKDGVAARNLHATTFLTIGKNSRFEDYQYNRTGCFWLGDAEVL